MFTLGVAAGIAAAGARIVYARFRGGGAGPLRIPLLRGWWLVAAVLGLQALLVGGRGHELPAPLWGLVVWCSHAAVAGVALANARRFRWMGLVALGLGLNLLAMGANGGLMPISPATLRASGNGHVLERVEAGQPLPHSKDVILEPNETRLPFLTDSLVVQGWRGGFSIGDVVVAVGVFLVLQAAVIPVRADRAAGTRRGGVLASSTTWH